MPHYHILWGGKDFDWQPHKTRAAAEASARELARIGESYLIAEIQDDECKTCDAIAADSGLRTH